MGKRKVIVTINTKLLQQYLKDNNLSKTKFCELAKISLYVLNKLLNNNANVKFTNIYKVTALMQIKLSEFLDFKEANN